MLKTQQDENTAIIRRNGGTFSALIKELEARQKSISRQRFPVICLARTANKEQRAIGLYLMRVG